MKQRIIILLAAAMMLVTPVLFAVSDQEKSDDKRAAAAAEQKSSNSDAANGGYLIGPEDVLKVDIWKEPEMSGNVPVRPDGKISLNLVGDVQAAGLTPSRLSAELAKLLKKYLDDPRVTVTVLTVNSRRVFVLGQVGHPGAFPLLPEMTVLQALSTAGGLSLYAAADKIYVLRNESGSQVKLAFQYKQVIKGRKPEQNILLRPGDTIVVP